MQTQPVEIKDQARLKSILITGCSSGIGFSAAQTLKKRGYRVFAGARKPQDLERLNALGLESIYLDLTDSASIEKAVAWVITQTGGTLDALFNNAGTMLVGSIEDLNREMQRKLFETNTFGPIELIRCVLPIMRKQGHGRIVQNSSILGIITLPYYGVYNASKFALEGFTNTLRQELQGTQIYISTLNPGPILSELRKNALRTYDQTLRNQSNVHADIYKRMEEVYFKSRNTKVALSPEAVVEQLMLALESPHPKPRYYVGRSAKLLAFLKRMLPERWLDKILITISKQNR